MASKCKDCRYYNGKRCEIYGARMPSSSCGTHFASYTKSETTTCKDCRFYNGRRCEIYGARMPSSSCSQFSRYR